MSKENYYMKSQSPVEYAYAKDKKNMRSINWNVMNDDKDLEVWNRVTQNFWLPENIPMSNDIPSWNTLSDDWKQLVTRTFTGLTLLDTVQASIGDIAQIKNSVTDHEQVIYANFAFMVGVHARSYGTIFGCGGSYAGIFALRRVLLTFLLGVTCKTSKYFRHDTSYIA